MLTLALDTSTDHGSVSVCRGERVLFAEDFVADRSHSSALFTILERARRLGDFDLIAIGLGPGSYAGVRIAIAAGTGLALATGARLVGLPSAAALRVGCYAVLGDARRGTYYWTVVSEGLCTQGPELLDEPALLERLRENTLPLLSTEPVPGFPTETAHPSAVLLARLAAAGTGLIAGETLEPIYLREAHITPPKPR